jgi:hypothetical protein
LTFTQDGTERSRWARAQAIRALLSSPDVIDRGDDWITERVGFLARTILGV